VNCLPGRNKAKWKSSSDFHQKLAGSPPLSPTAQHDQAVLSRCEVAEVALPEYLTVFMAGQGD
jgi:hypothetical protein